MIFGGWGEQGRKKGWIARNYTGEWIGIEGRDEISSAGRWCVERGILYDWVRREGIEGIASQRYPFGPLGCDEVI